MRTVHRTEEASVRRTRAGELPRIGPPADGLPARLEQAARLFDVRVQCIVFLFLFVALRREETRLLEWVRLDLDDGWIRFTAKGAIG